MLSESLYLMISINQMSNESATNSGHLARFAKASDPQSSR